MKSSKVMTALVTLGLAAAATPAMALENQFSGSFTSYYDLSNYSAAGGTPVKDAPTENYFVQRVRLGYTAKATEDVKLVTKFEFDYGWYGNSSYGAGGRNQGGAIGADSVQMETKNLYLDLNAVKGLNAKIGMQGNTDAFKGVIFDADMAGILLSHEYSNAGVSAGFFRFGDSTNSSTWAGIDKIGKYTYDMFTLDGKFNINKDIKVGAAYYYIADNRDNGSTTTTITTPTGGPLSPIGQLSDGTLVYNPLTTFSTTTTTTPNPRNDTKVHTLGLNAEAAVGPLTLTGFVLGQFGDYNASKDADGYAFNLGAKMPLGGGTGRTEFLYASGGNDGKSLYVPQSPIGSEGGGFYDNEMILLSRDKNAFTIDNAIVYDANNNNQGVIFASAGYDYPFTPKLSGSANLGLGWVAKDLANHDSKYLGTELNCEVNYKLIPSVTLGARAGYVVLGDYFKTAAGSPDDPYDVKLIAKFAF
ncbi:MAG: porin [Desulfuromonadaceae bacterium]|nr:porin [Desulfuromonadaceae bacterium]